MHSKISEKLEIVTDKNNNRTVISSTKKGRFHVETARTESMDLMLRNKIKSNDSLIDNSVLLSIIEKQNTQIELLFEMIKNNFGNEILFQKEFISESDDTYELINQLKKKR